MLQIINVSKVRNNLSSIIEMVMRTKTPVVVVKDSQPSVVMYPYEQVLKEAEEKEKLWNERYNFLIKEGKKTGKKWLKEKGINVKTLNEEKIYELIEES